VSAVNDTIVYDPLEAKALSNRDYPRIASVSHSATTGANDIAGNKSWAEFVLTVPYINCFRYTLRLLIIQVAFSKFFGSCSRSSQVPGHPEVAYEFPAQSPQNVMSKMMDILTKNLLSGLQFVGRSLAEGMSQLEGFGVPVRISCGTAAR